MKITWKDTAIDSDFDIVPKQYHPGYRVIGDDGNVYEVQELLLHHITEWFFWKSCTMTIEYNRVLTNPSDSPRTFKDLYKMKKGKMEFIERVEHAS